MKPTDFSSRQLLYPLYKALYEAFPDRHASIHMEDRPKVQDLDFVVYYVNAGEVWRVDYSINYDRISTIDTLDELVDVIYADLCIQMGVKE